MSEIYDNPELEQEITALLINWGYWSGQGMGGGAIHPMFQGAVKPQGSHAVSEDDAMNADRCIARMREGSREREMIFAVYNWMLDPHSIEVQTGLEIDEQRLHLAFARRLFWMHWDALINGNEFALEQVRIVKSAERD